MNSRIVLMLALVAVSLSLSGCMWLIYPSPSKECKKWFGEEINFNNDETRQRIQTAPASTIYDFYMCKAKYGHYSYFSWIDVVGKRNAGVVEYVKNVNFEAYKTHELEFTVDLLWYIDHKKYVAVHQDNALLQSLWQAVERSSRNADGNYLVSRYNQLAFRSDYFLQTYSFSNPACADVIRSFYRLDKAGRVERFQAMDAEERFQVLACGEEVSRSDMLFLVPKFVADTPKAELMMRDKLAASRDIGVVNAALDVLWELARQGRYDFTKDKDFVRLVLAKAEGVRKGDWPSEKSDLLQAVSNK